MKRRATLGHIALVTTDPTAIAAFYHELLGLEVILQGSLHQLGEFAFLSGRPDAQLPELAFVTEPGARHIALQVESLSALKDVHAEAKARGIPIPIPPLNHRVSLSLYLRDPEGNILEVFWATGERADAPHAEPVDLERPDSELLALIRGREAIQPQAV